MNTHASGSVTFLFTDIEGSVKIAQEQNIHHSEIFSKHNSILRKQIEKNNGRVFEIIGDAFCSSFTDPADAVRASVDIQLELKSENWFGSEVKVRMGIHNGYAEWNGKDYMGYLTLARVNRIMSSANGGQIIISEEAKGLIVNLNFSSFSFRDLGERRLKDLIKPIKLFQIIHSGIDSEFPPLKTLDSRPNNLPVQLTSFIGREKEIEEVKKLISEHRLLTLLGTGGTGKTRLALQTGADLIDEFKDGVFLIDLASLENGKLISFKMADTFGVKEQQGKSVEEVLKEYFRDKDILILLDNCEHIISECAVFSEKFLRSSPKMKIMSTSREAMKCSGEAIHNVLPLKFPDPKENITTEQLTQFEAVRLFIERALSVNQKFRVNKENAPSLAGICFQLDGIPLAIELAAARIKILPLEKIYEKLKDRFKLLTGGSRNALPRQKTLSAMIDWSYDLLHENEKILFSRFSVFSGGWTLEAAEQICADDLIEKFEIIDILTELLDKSLIESKESTGDIRFNMLVTIRQYAENKFNESNDIRLNHFLYFRNLSKSEYYISENIDQFEWIKLMDAEQDNIRTAVKWGLENSCEKTFEFLNELSEYFKIKGNYSEGYDLFKEVLSKNHEVSDISKANLIHNSALMCYGLGKLSELEELTLESLEIYEKNNHDIGIALCNDMLGCLYCMTSNDLTKISEYYDKALSVFKELGNKKNIAHTLYNISFIVHRKGDIEGAVKIKKESLEIFNELKDQYNSALILSSLGILYFKTGEFETANYYTEESLSISYQINDKYLISINLVNLGCIDSGLKNYDKANEIFESALLIIKECGYRASLIPALFYLGEVKNCTGKYSDAVKLFRKSIEKSQESGIEFFIPNNIFGLGESFYYLKQYEKSFKYFQFMKIIKSGHGMLISDSQLRKCDDYIDLFKKVLPEKELESQIETWEKFKLEDIINTILTEKI